MRDRAASRRPLALRSSTDLDRHIQTRAAALNEQRDVAVRGVDLGHQRADVRNRRAVDRQHDIAGLQPRARGLAARLLDDECLADAEPLALLLRRRAQREPCLL
ncbi:hypothetical protein, partial [Burkholderia sp. BCCCDS10]|uniref:hypothetical protein n=1 Tax=Burkholderia sp. BCCCDS10 TaxID=3390237 RepID=UPI003D2F158B